VNAEKDDRLASAADMAHELNNVLMAVMQVGEMLRRHYPDDPRLAKMADNLFAATERGRRLTSQVLRGTGDAGRVPR
jgi:signal transduction histidine kinase